MYNILEYVLIVGIYLNKKNYCKKINIKNC